MLYKGKITYVSQPTKGIASDGTYWDFSPELPEYLKDDLRLVYTHSGIGGFAKFNVSSVDNRSRVTLSGTSDSVFLAADAPIIGGRANNIRLGIRRGVYRDFCLFPKLSPRYR